MMRLFEPELIIMAVMALVVLTEERQIRALRARIRQQREAAAQSAVEVDRRYAELMARAAALAPQVTPQDEAP